MTSDAPPTRRDALADWVSFLQRSGHVLHIRPDLLFQEAAHQPEALAPARAAARLADGGRVTRPWLRWLNRTPRRVAGVLTLSGRGPLLACGLSPSGDEVVAVAANTLVFADVTHPVLTRWDARTGRQLIACDGPPGRVTAAAIAPDGATAASVYADGALELWDAQSGRRQRADRAATVGSRADCCAWSPRGDRVAWGDAAGGLWVWPQDGFRFALPRHEARVAACAFSPDGIHLVSAAGAALRWWDLERRAEQARLDGPEGRTAVACAVSPDGALVASGWTGGLVRLWSPGSNEVVDLAGHTGRVTACAFAPGGARLVTASDDHTVRLWDLRTRVQAGPALEHSDFVTACACSPGGRHLVSGDWRGTVKIWDLEVEGSPATGRERGLGSQVSACAFSADGRLAVAAFWNGELDLWEATRGRHLATLAGHQDCILACAFSPDGALVASASRDLSVRVWRTENPAHPQVLEGHSGAVGACAFSPDGAVLLSGSDDGTLRLWDPQTGITRREVLAHAGGVTACLFSPDGTVIVSAGKDWQLKVWEWASKERPALLADGLADGRLAMSPDGSRLLAVPGGALGPPKLWDLDRRALVATLVGLVDGNCFGFSPDGRWVYFVSYDRTLKLWEAAGGEPVAVLSAPGESAWRGGVSPQGRLFLALSDDVLKLFRLPAGSLLLTCWLGGKASAAAWGPDGRHLAVGDTTGGLQLLRLENLPPEE